MARDYQPIRRHSTRLSRAHDDLEATAGLEAEASEVHLASDDYPEMGDILRERPDPGARVTVVGSLRKHAAATYGRPDDARDDDYNGGPQDAGVYWAEPAQQQWRDENLGPQEEAPPPPWAPAVMEAELPAPLARLAQIEEARQFFGAPAPGAAPLRHCATTINGTQIDGHGDAPAHGTVPRASAPDSYDDRSTEGIGDPKWSDPIDRKDLEDNNGATVGMYPEGMSGGSGPGLEIGPFVARQVEGRVPWTGAERGTLHRWQAAPTGTWGDFVPSSEFTSGGARQAPEAEREREEERASELRSEGSDRWSGRWRAPFDAGDPSWHGIIDYHDPEAAAGELPELSKGEGERPWDPGGYSYGVATPEDHDDIIGYEHPGMFGHTLSHVAAFGPDPAEEARMRDHLLRHHGWTAENADRVEARGDRLSHMHDTLHQMGMANHAHQDPAEEARQRELSDRFGDPYRADTRRGHPGQGGTRLEDPGDAIANSAPRDWEAVRDRMPLSAWSMRHQAVSDERWRAFLMSQHGLSAEQLDQAQAVGASWPLLHQHMSRMRADRERRRQESVGTMFGEDLGEVFRRKGPERANLARPEHGGHYQPGDQSAAIIGSEEARPEYPDETMQRSPASFQRMMSALDLPHPHDDDSPLDAGPSEGDDGYPGPHDDSQSPFTASLGAAAAQVIAQLEEDYPPDALAWLRHARVSGPRYVPLRDIDWSDRHTWTSYRQPRRVAGFLDTMTRKAAKGERLKPALVVATPGRAFIGDGHHRGLAQLLAAGEGRSPAGVWAYVAAVGRTEGPWDTMHGRQLRAPSRDDDSTALVPGPDAPPGEVADFQGRVDQAVSGLDEHYGTDNSLDDGDVPPDNSPEAPDNTGNPQATGPELSGARPGSSGDVREWPLAGAAVSETGPAKTQGSGDGKVRRQRKAHLAALVAATASPGFRFEFTASWPDVVAKAKRIRREGHVRITHASRGMVIGEVRGDHDTYESGIQRPPGKPQTIQHWACGCPWASFHQDKSLGTRYAGRPCSHVMALQFEAQARGMFGKEVARDEQAPWWSRRDVVVKSWPPYEGEPHAGRWSEYWLAPSAARTAARAGLRPFSQLQPHEQASVAQYHQQMIEEGNAEPGSTPHDYLYDSRQEPKASFLERYMDADDEFKREYPNGPADWEAHHQDTVARHPIPSYPGSGRWPLIVRDDNPNYVDDGYHRMHSYIRDGATHLPTVRMYRTAAPGSHDGPQDHPQDDSQVQCYYRHDGPCPGPAMERTAESLRHPRPAGFRSEIKPNPAFDPGSYTSTEAASHVLTGYLGSQAVGRIHFEASDDGQAYHVNMMHTYPGAAGEHKGIGSAMMDDLYSHVKRNGQWLDHGWRQPAGNNWWATYREPYPEVNTHHAHPDEGWKEYFSPHQVASDAAENFATSGGRGMHTRLTWRPGSYPDDEREDKWTHVKGLQPPAQQATAALIAAGEDPGEIAALALLAGIRAMRVTADQANAPWGSENVSHHPPQKPYGATEPPNKGQSPASYGFLSAPDPDNWGGIQDDIAQQMPLSNTAAHQVLAPGAPGPLPPGLRYPDIGDFREDQESFGYTDRASAAGPSTSLTPRDPGGIRMEESRKDCPCCGGTGEHDTGRECYGCDASGSADGYSGNVPCDGTKPYGTDSQGHQVELDPMDGWQHLDGSVSHDDGSAVTDQPVTPDDGEGERARLGIDGTAGDAQDVPHKFADGGMRGCEACGLDHSAAVHQRTAAGTPFPYHGQIPQLDGALAELRDEPEPALPSTTGDDIEATAAADGTIGGGDAAGAGDDQSPSATAGLGEFGASSVASADVQNRPVASGSVRDQFRARFGGTPMGDLARETFPQAQEPSVATQQPGMGSFDEPLMPGDQSIQTIGNQQWSGGGADSDEVAVPAGEPQGSIDDIVAAFQRSAAASQFGGPGASRGGGQYGDGDIAAAAREHLSKTADVLPDAEAAELIAEGRGQRARNLGLLRLQGTHYEELGDERGDEVEDDLVWA